LKKKSNLLQKTASPEQIYFVSKNGIKVYPITKTGAWYIEVDNNGRIQRFEKKVSQNELNEALAKTVIFYYNKLKEKK
jgi:hypothetical protein